jgi:ABC-type branched-subunit amino acid transport system substrate-binding protein
MPSTHPHRRFRLLLVLVLAMALVLAACGNSDDDDDAASGPTTTSADAGGEKVTLTGVPGVTDDEISFAAFGTNSNNPLGTCVLDCYVDGIEAYFAYRNSEGGVHGRQLVLSKTLDDELTKNQQRALEIVSANDVFAAFSATQFASGWGDIAKAGMPLYVWNIHPAETAGRDTIFGEAGSLCIDCTQRVVAHIAERAKAKNAGVLGYGISENSKKSAAAVKKSLELYSSEIGGIKVPYFNDDLAFGLPNGIAPEVTAMKNAGVDVIFASIDLNGMKTLANELKRQGLGDVPMWHPNTYDQDFVTAAGDLFEGDYVGVAFRPFEAASGESSLNLFKKWMGETKSKITEISMRGWISAATAAKGLEEAGPNFDRQKVIDATNALTDWTADGLIAPLDYSRQHNPPTQDDPTTNGSEYECTSILQVVDGKFEVVGDRAKPWTCWSNENRDWAEPESMNFE